MLYPTVLSTAGALLSDRTTCWAYLKSDLPKDFLNFGIVLFFFFTEAPHPHPILLKIIARLVTDSSAETFYDPAHYSLIGIVWLYPGIEPAR